jgi:hypothetical protein
MVSEPTEFQPGDRVVRTNSDNDRRVGTIVGKHLLAGLTDLYYVHWPVPGGAMVTDEDLAKWLRLATADDIAAFDELPKYRGRGAASS